MRSVKLSGQYTCEFDHNPIFSLIVLLRCNLNYRVFIPSGAGSPGFGGIFESLKEYPGTGVWAGDMNPRAYGRNLADGFALMPPGDSADYIPAVVEHAHRFNCNVVLPITTRELYPLSEQVAILGRAGLQIAISPHSALKIANNKARLYAFLKESDIPCPAFFTASTRETLIAQVHALGYPTSRVIMKPAEGNGSRGFRIIATPADVQDHYFDTKAGALLTSPEALQHELPENFPAEMIVSEYLPGEEYSVDMLVNQGETLACLVRLREKTISGISVRGHFIRHTEMEETSVQIANALQLHGPIGMQFKMNSEGRPRLLEINPRLQGAVSTARFAGVNFPLLSVKLAMGEKIAPVFPEFPADLSFNRYWKDIKI